LENAAQSIIYNSKPPNKANPATPKNPDRPHFDVSTPMATAAPVEEAALVVELVAVDVGLAVGVEVPEVVAFV